MKQLLFTLTLLITLSSFSQNQKATLFFRDGTSLEGLARITNFGDKIKFKKDKNSEKIIYNSQKVDKIVIRENDEDVTYQYKIIKNRKTPLLLEPLKEGKVTLYRDLKQGYSPGMQMGGYGVGGMGMNFGGGRSYSISSYYVSKDNGNIVIHLGDKGTIFTKNFKKAASEYFKGCSELVKKIQSKEYRKRDVVEIVEYYNENCDD